MPSNIETIKKLGPISAEPPETTVGDAPDMSVTKMKVADATTIIQLKNNISVYRIPEVPGRAYFDFLRQQTEQGIDAAIRSLIMSTFVDVNTGQPLTITQIDDEGGIGFEGVATLADTVLELFPGAREKMKSLQQAK